MGRIPRIARILAAIALFVAAVGWNAIDTFADRNPGPGRPDVALADVRDAGYYPAQAWLDGVNPYDPEAYRAAYDDVGQAFPLYSPLQMLVHLPLTWFPPEGARVGFYWFSLALLAAQAAITLRVAGRRSTVAATIAFTGFLAATHSGRLSLVSGQTTPLLGIGVALALAGPLPVAATAGVVLALTKPTIGVPLVAVALARGRVRPAIIGSAIAAIVSALMGVRLIDASGGLSEFLRGIGNDLDVTATIGSGRRVDAASLIARTFGAYPPLAFEILCAVVLGALACAAIHRATRDRPLADAPLVLAFLTPPLLFFHGSWDLLVVVPALVLLVRADPSACTPRRVRLMLFWLLLYVLVNPANSEFAERLFPDGPLDFFGTTVRGFAYLAAWLLAWDATRRLRAGRA